MKNTCFFVILCLSSCSAVIYHLNDTEHARMPPLFSLEEYEPCLVEEGSIYCVLQLTLHAGPGNQLMRVIKEYSGHTVKHYNYSIIDSGVCVTKTCQKYISQLETSEELSSTLEACLNDSLYREYGLSAKVSKLYYCDHHNEPVHIDAWDWTVLALILALGILNCVGSLYDYYLSRQSDKIQKRENSLLLCFSVMRNWERLTQIETGDHKVGDLQFVHGIRVISNLSTVLLHSMMIFIVGFSKNPHEIEKAYEVPLYHVMFNGLNMVQVFFFISGTLTVYYLQIEEQKRTVTVLDIPKIILLRLSRLVPALAMTLALVTSWTRHVGSGPLWKVFVTDTLVADCRNYWWHHLLFINNYMQKGKYCLFPTWHLAAEMQVFLAAVSVYLVSRRLLAALLLLSALAPALHTVFQDLDVIIAIPQSFRDLDSRTLWHQHVLGHNHLACFIMGMFTAIRLHGWQKTGRHLTKSRWVSVAQYVSVCAVPLILYSGRVFYSDGARAGLAARSAYSAAVRVLLGCACALAIPAFFSKTTTYIKSALSWRRWVVPSRLTYCVFLLHMVFVHMYLGSETELTYFSLPNVLVAFLVIALTSYVASVPLYLMVEAPFTGLFKTLVRRSTNEISTIKRASTVSKTSDTDGYRKEKDL